MALFASSSLSEDSFARKYIFLDCDFLSLLFTDFDAVNNVAKLCSKGYLMIDAFTKFEFLQSVYSPVPRDRKEVFLANDLFHDAIEHQTIFDALKKNALTLSYLYAHNNCTGASVVDLFLASRATIHPNALIVTGNKKHFSNALFDTVGMLTNEKQNGYIQTYSVLSFSSEKYSAAIARWQELK